MKNKNFQILEIWTFSVKFIPKTIKDRGNLSTSYQSPQFNPLNKTYMGINYLFVHFFLWGFFKSIPYKNPFQKHAYCT
jgi:hypothetical protein